MSVDVADLVATLRGEDLGFTAMVTRADAAMSALSGHSSSALGAVSKLALGLTALAAGGLAASVKAASDFQTQLIDVQNNTTMTAADVGIMRQAILDLASHSPASFDQLSAGFMHITKLGFDARDAVLILTQAMMSAVSTGGDVGATAQMLANVMHEFGASAKQAGQYMDVVHQAVAKSNSTLEQFVDSSGKAIAMAANMGVSVTDVSAALAALTRHGQDSAQASTLIAGALSKIANPSKAAEKEIMYLSNLTGVDLVHDFSKAGLASKGLSGVMADMALATKGNAQEILQLIPATRGGLAAMILTGTGAKDYKQILLSLNDTMAGKLHPTLTAYQRTQATTAFQMGVLKNNVQILGITIGSVLLPPLVQLVKQLIVVVQSFLNWAQHTGAVQKALAAIQQLLSTQVVPALRNVGTWVATVVTKFQSWLSQHPAVVAMIKDIAQTALLFAANGVAGKAILWCIGVLFDLLFRFDPLMAMLTLFATAWEKNWGGIQQKLQAVWSVLGPILGLLGHALDTLDPGMGAVGDLVALGAALVGVAAAMRAIEAAQGAIAVIKGLGGILGGGGGGGGKSGPALGAGADKDIQALTKAITTYLPPLTTAIALHMRTLTTAIALHLPNLRTAINTHIADLVRVIDGHVPALVAALTAIAPKLDGLKTAITTHVSRLVAGLTAIAPRFDALTSAVNTHFQPLTDAINNMPHTLGVAPGGGGKGKGTTTTPTSGTTTLTGADALTTALGTLNTTVMNRLIPALHALSDTIKKIPTTITITGGGSATIPATVDLRKAIQDAVNALKRAPVDLTPAVYLNWATLKSDLQTAVNAIKRAPVDLTGALSLNAATLRADLLRAVQAIKPAVDLVQALDLTGLPAAIRKALQGQTFYAQVRPAGLVDGINKAIGAPRIFYVQVRPAGLADAVTKAILSGVQALSKGKIDFGGALDNFAQAFWTAIWTWMKDHMSLLGGIIGGPLGGIIAKLTGYAGGSSTGGVSGQNVDFSNTGGSPLVIQIPIYLDKNQIGNVVFNVAAADRRMRPELVSA